MYSICPYISTLHWYRRAYLPRADILCTRIHVFVVSLWHLFRIIPFHCIRLLLFNGCSASHINSDGMRTFTIKIDTVTLYQCISRHECHIRSHDVHWFMDHSVHTDYIYIYIYKLMVCRFDVMLQHHNSFFFFISKTFWTTMKRKIFKWAFSNVQCK